MIQLIRLCNIDMLQKLVYVAYVTNFHSVCLVSMSVCYNICSEREIQLLFGQSYMFGDVIIWYVQWQNKNDRTQISFYIWFSYTSYIVCISIVKCWSWSIYDYLDSTVCILTINFDSRRYKPISLSLYNAAMLRTLVTIGHLYYKHAYGGVLECWRFVSKSKDYFGYSK